jgi:hypothetical protein
LFIEGPASLEAFLSNLEDDPAPVWLKRLCVTAPSAPLEFVYQKRQIGAELLVIRLYARLGELERACLEASLQLPNERGMGPWERVTLLTRRFGVTAAGGADALMLGSDPGALDLGQPMFVPIGADMPPGTYRLEIDVVCHWPRWLTVSRTTPGDFQVRIDAVDRR